MNQNIAVFCESNLCFSAHKIYQNAVKLKRIVLFMQMLEQIMELSDEGMHKTIQFCGISKYNI